MHIPGESGSYGQSCTRVLTFLDHRRTFWGIPTPLPDMELARTMHDFLAVQQGAAGATSGLPPVDTMDGNMTMRSSSNHKRGRHLNGPRE